MLVDRLFVILGQFEQIGQLKRNSLSFESVIQRFRHLRRRFEMLSRKIEISPVHFELCEMTVQEALHALIPVFPRVIDEKHNDYSRPELDLVL